MYKCFIDCHRGLRGNLNEGKNVKVAVVLGTRAQMVKMAPVLRLLQERKIDYWFLHTGQHKETFDDLRKEFGVKDPDAYMVNSTEDAKNLVRFGGWGTKALLSLLFRRKRLHPVKGGLTLVHGDTASTVWGALIGRMTGNDVLHVESGLRSFQIFDPFPEEINRLITFKLSTMFACPGPWAVANLKTVKGEKVDIGGNTLYDAYLHARQGSCSGAKNGVKYCVFSVHRFETIYNKKRLTEVVDSILDTSEDFDALVVAHPALVHQLTRTGLISRLRSAEKVQLIPRRSYGPFVKLLLEAEFVITDGGSNQEELFYMGKPTLVLRSATERVEGLKENAIMSRPSRKAIKEFRGNYRSFIRPPVMLASSPSTEVVDWIERRLGEL